MPVATSFVAFGATVGASYARTQYPPVEVLFSGNTTVIDQPIEYPEGAPKVTAAIVSMTPGAVTGWHRHDAPLFAYVIEGEVTVYYGEDGMRTYQEGEAFLEAQKSYHNGTNTFGGTTRIFAVFMGDEAVDKTVMESTK